MGMAGDGFPGGSFSGSLFQESSPASASAAPTRCQAILDFKTLVDYHYRSLSLFDIQPTRLSLLRHLHCARYQ